MKNLRILIIGISFLFLGNLLTAQNILNVNGTVTDANGLPIPNCDITIEGDSFSLFISTSISTDTNGNYSLGLNLGNAVSGTLLIYPQDSCIQSGDIQHYVNIVNSNSIVSDYTLCDINTDCNISIDPPMIVGATAHFPLSTEGVAPYSYTYDFGDGSPVNYSNLQTLSAVNIYPHTGTFSPTFTMIDANGCTSTHSVPVNIVTDTTTITLTTASIGGYMYLYGNLNNPTPQHTGVSRIYNLNENSYTISSSPINVNGTHHIQSSGAGFTVSSTIYGCVTGVKSDGTSSTKCDYAYYNRNSDSLIIEDFYHEHTNTVNYLISAGVQGTAPFTYNWDFGDGQTYTEQSQNHYSSSYHPYLNAGIYNVCLTVTDSFGISETHCENITISSGVTCTTNFTSQQVNPTTYSFNGSNAGGLAPYSYSWSVNNITVDTLNLTPFLIHTFDTLGSHDVCLTVTDSLGCTSIFCDVIDIYFNLVQGNIYNDINTDCVQNNNELNLSNILIQIANTNSLDTSFSITDSFGNYQLHLSDGNYEIAAVPLSLYWQSCPSQTAILTGTDTVNLSLGLQPIVNCSNLSVNISSPVLVYGYSDTYVVNYCNTGTQDESNAYIEIELDPFLTLDSTSIAYTQIGNIYTFQIGTININECGNFDIHFTVNTAANLGQIHCTEANIFPNQICLTNGTAWNGANIIVNTECIQNDSIRFTIQNIGGNGMTQPRNYWIIEDQILPLQGTYQLQVGEDTTWTIAANQGAIYFIQAEQEITHPLGNNMPTAVSSDCNSPSLNPNLINQFSLGDAFSFTDIDCQQNVYSYDPNDKQGFPKGYGNEHYITKNDKIEYMIRFQNTGTFTAFNVVVKDSIDISTLDLSTLQIQGSSHNYELEIENGNILVFRFNNIMLPDSNSNEPASHGFIRFKIGQKTNNAIGTVIENSAAIYFDFNAPIITNTTFHTVGENFIQVVSTVSIKEKIANVTVFPNPFTEQATFKIETEKRYQNVTLTIFNIMGQAVRTIQQNGNNQIVLDRDGLTSGVYFYRIQSEGLMLDSGKLMVK